MKKLETGPLSLMGLNSGDNYYATKLTDALVRWYSQDDEDKICLTRTEVGYILRKFELIPW